MQYVVFLDIPPGLHIGISIDWVKQFFQNRDDSSRAFLRLCINLQTPIPSRLVKDQEDKFKDAIIDQLIDPTFWINKSIFIAFRGTPYGIMLGHDRRPIDAEAHDSQP